MKKEYWIRKGTNKWSYKYSDENDDEVESLLKGDQYYDAIVDHAVEGGTHVIEYSEYEKLRMAAKALEDALEFECGNRCAHQNPCNAKEALEQWRKGK